MSPEAGAALLGRVSMSMTMTYTRISDRAVATEYGAVTEQVEALYTQPETNPADTSKARTCADCARRPSLLGNGPCTRPAVLDCRYETMCESCTHFASAEDHRTTLTDQLANATQCGEPRRQKTSLELITKLGKAPA